MNIFIDEKNYVTCRSVKFAEISSTDFSAGKRNQKLVDN